MDKAFGSIYPFGRETKRKKEHFRDLDLKKIDNYQKKITKIEAHIGFHMHIILLAVNQWK